MKNKLYMNNQRQMMAKLSLVFGNRFTDSVNKIIH